MGSWKAGSPTSNPQRLKVAKSWISTSLPWHAGVAIQRQPRSRSISCSPHLGYHNSIFWYLLQALRNHNELVERAAALRDLKLLEGSGGLDFTKGIPQTNMWNKSFGTASHFLNMETWGQHRKMETNGLGDHKPKHLFETSLWQAWVAWIKRGQILGTENVRRKIIRIHHWFTTQTSTLTMFELDCDSQFNNSPLPTFWCLHEVNAFAIKNSGNGFLKQNMSKESPFGSAPHFANMGSYKSGSPTSNALLRKAQSRRLFISLQQSPVTTESTINILYIIQSLDTITVLYGTILDAWHSKKEW